jgi:hypothetical protein
MSGKASIFCNVSVLGEIISFSDWKCGFDCLPKTSAILPQCGTALAYVRNGKCTCYIVHSLYFCAPYGSHNKQRLLPQNSIYRDVTCFLWGMNWVPVCPDSRAGPRAQPAIGHLCCAVSYWETPSFKSCLVCCSHHLKGLLCVWLVGPGSIIIYRGNFVTEYTWNE